MAQHLHDILSQWYPSRDQHRWVLGTLIDVKGSNYRRTGAMILINELGQYYGLISGGCLEKNLLNEVKKVFVYDRPLRVFYDSSEQGDLPWAMALGCGGQVTVLLQPISAANQYHQLDLLYLALEKRAQVRYAIYLGATADVSNRLIDMREPPAGSMQPDLEVNSHSNEFLVVDAKAKIHLMIFGGGLDAIPLVAMAAILGWKITLVDARSSYAQTHHFPQANIIRVVADSTELRELLPTIDAAIVMTHNIEMDARAIAVLQDSSARYVGLLGPEHRKQKVFTQANVEVSKVPLFGPMGLEIGGDLPESIALATLAECHRILEAPVFQLSTKYSSMLIENMDATLSSPVQEII